MRLSIIVIFTIFLQSIVAAQQVGDWHAVPIPDEASTVTLPGVLYSSQNLGMIVYSGVFLDSINTKFIAGYNGSEWEILDDSVGGNFQTIVDYDNGILVGGGTPYVGNQYMPHIAYFDGANWTFPWTLNNNVRKLIWINEGLHILGTFTTIDGQAIQYAAVLNNEGNWENLFESANFTTTPLFHALAYYEGSYYLGGNFELENGLQDFARIEDGHLVQVGAGLTGSWTSVGDLVVYQNELYLSGSIPQVQGNIGNHILKWNGEELQTVGPVFTDESGQLNLGASITKTLVHNGYLYTGGIFSNIDDQTISHVARWDGSRWCGYLSQGFNGIWGIFFYHFAFIGDRLLMMEPYNEIAGESITFWILDDIENVNNCTDPVNVKTLKPAIFSIYPNPATAMVHIQSEDEIISIEIIDAIGKSVLSRETRGKDLQIELKAFSPGMYLVKIETHSGIGFEKLVVR